MFEVEKTKFKEPVFKNDSGYKFVWIVGQVEVTGRECLTLERRAAGCGANWRRSEIGRALGGSHVNLT
jgi:hypothetical protein